MSAAQVQAQRQTIGRAAHALAPAVNLAGGGECDVSSAAGMLRLELLVHGRLIQLGREAVRNLATEVGTGYQGPRVKRGKVVFRFKGNRPKTVPGRYGTVTVKRAYYASGSGEIRVPLDEQQWRARLRQGGAAVIDELRQVRDAHRAHGDDIQRQINYLEANRERMNYQRHRNDHLPIGSGTVESACKHVVAARM